MVEYLCRTKSDFERVKYMKKYAVCALALLLGAAFCLPAGAEAIRDETRGDAVLIYEEKFDYEDTAFGNETLETLGWAVQNKADGAYSDSTAKYAISDGQLQVENTSGRDSYALILPESTMSKYAGQVITLQYDVTYDTAGDVNRYFAILTNYAGQIYNSFHFRNKGTANNQTHFNGSWITYDVADGADAYATADDSDGKTTSIAYKLLGKKINGASLFFEVPVTIRIVLDPSLGATVYMKLAEKEDDAFVMVSRTNLAATGTENYFTATTAYNAICFKVGGSQNGYVDNIAIWTGNGGYPPAPEPEPEPEQTTPDPIEPIDPDQEPDPGEEPTNEPEKVKEPHDIVNKIALGAVALFGCAIIYDKSKKEKAASEAENNKKTGQQ